jgi:cell division protein FtsB
MLFIYLTLNLIIGDNGLLKYIELKSTRNRLYAETVALERQNEDISAQIDSLKNNPDTAEEFAREYGLTKKGELIFKFDDKE